MEGSDVAFRRLDHSYSPETIAVMTTAFDSLCQSLSKRMNDNDDLFAGLWH